jgi:uncharacterized protein (TIGR02217 family)
MVDTSFMDDVIFPTAISRGSLGGPDWPAQIWKLSNGMEERNSRWSSPLRTYDVKYGVRTPNEAYEILRYYMSAMGRLRGFRFLDWTDYKSCPPSDPVAFDDQVIGVGDGAETQFQLVVTYQVVGHTFVREIANPYGTVLIGKNGSQLMSGYSVDMATGVVTFDVAPALGHSLTWGGTFHTPVRFDCKLDQVEMHGPIENIPSIFLQELRL